MTDHAEAHRANPLPPTDPAARGVANKTGDHLPEAGTHVLPSAPDNPGERNPAGPNELGRMPDGVIGEANVNRIAQDQAEGEERAGNGKQDVATGDAPTPPVESDPIV